MSIEAMKRWLECADRCESIDGLYSWADVVSEMRQAIEQAQEPVIDKSAAIRIATSFGCTPQRQWVGLTNEQIWDIWCDVFPRNIHQFNVTSDDIDNFARVIEAKLKEKNT